jgi:hypothetical protein
MSQTNQHDLADTIGADVGPLALLKQIVARVEGLDATGSDDDIDLWWGSVEIDRLASGLTLAAIAKLAEPSGEGDPKGPWLQKSDETGDEPTQLTPQGREAVRQIGAAGIGEEPPAG